MMRYALGCLLLAGLLVGCGEPVTPTPPPEPSPPPAATATAPDPTSPPRPTVTATGVAPTATHPATPTPRPPTATPTAPPTATPDPYAGLSIASLRQRAYGGEGQIVLVEKLGETAHFDRYLIRYPSDGLQIGGFVNIPRGAGPFPVIIVNHGYMPPRSYETLTYTTKYADALAAAGYLVLHPNFRNHVGSDEGPNPFRIGYAIDVLNLIALLPTLPEADPARVGLWGHSMGGGINLRVLTVTDQVRGALIVGSMSGDEAENYSAIMRWSGGAAARRGDLPAPPEDTALYAAVSPINALDHITAPLSIHHGEQDEQVPFAWSVRLAEALSAAGVAHEFFAYPDQPHNFWGEGYETLMQRTIAFFDRTVKTLEP